MTIAVDLVKTLKRKTLRADGQPPAERLLWAKAGHSLRQPVQAALYIAHVLKAQAVNDEKRLRLLDPLEGALKGLQVQVELLTELARAGQIEPRPVILEAIVTDVIADLASVATAQGSQLRACMPRSTTVASDHRLLKLAVAGIIHNALRLRVDGPVLIGIRPRRTKCRLEVYFNGPGISEAQSEAAFICLSDPRDGRPTGSPALGMGFISHICRLLAHTMEIDAPSHRLQRIACELPFF